MRERERKIEGDREIKQQVSREKATQKERQINKQAERNEYKHIRYHATGSLLGPDSLRFSSSPEPKAHKVSLKDGHDPASVRRPSVVVVVHNFKDRLL